MRKNSLYTSAPEVYTALIENKEGVVQFTKKLDDYDNALSWCQSMAMSEDGYAYKLTDTDTKRVLSSGRNINGSMEEYEKGTKVELEHIELIKKMLIEAGKVPTEEKVAAIAREIAKVHIEEDPNYYEKLEKMERT